MILSDLLDRPVIDADGSQIGFAIDVRFVVDGAPGPLLAGAVLHKVMVSPRTSSSFFGYERSGVSAPWPLGRLLERRHKDAFFVDWSDVAMIGTDGVHLRTGYRREPLRDEE